MIPLPSNTNLAGARLLIRQRADREEKCNGEMSRKLLLPRVNPGVADGITRSLK